MSAMLSITGDSERPAAVHAEMTILGAMLVEEERLTEALGLLVPSDFSLDSHRKIFASCERIANSGHAVDFITVADDLRKRRELDSIGSMPYLASLSEGLPQKLSISSYVRIVRDKSLMRQLIEVCESGMSSACDQAEASLDVLNRVALRISEISMRGDVVKPKPIAELVVPAWEEMRAQREFKGKLLGIPTGIDVLDTCTTGWRNGELTYVGALPGRGKTSFMLQSIMAAAKAGFGVGCISLEMRAGQLMRRMAILESGIHAQRWRDLRTMGDIEFFRSKDAMFALGELPISVVDQSGLNPTQISSLARRMHADGAKIIFVDFIQIIKEDGKDRREAINRVSAALRDTCKALDIPFVVASQLARRDSTPNRRPTIQDLRESGNLEQDAHNVLLLFRPKKENGDWSGEDEIIIDKAREGATGVVWVTYDERTLTYIGRQA
jgi:replicative DNA helicase